MTESRIDTRELGGGDPIDLRLPEAPPRRWSRWHVRAALGLRPAIAPALLFVPLGAALGPAGANIVTIDVLRHLSPVVSVALAVLGVLVGLGLGRRRPPATVLYAAAVETAITITTVFASVWYLVSVWGLSIAAAPVIVAAAAGVVASVSSAPGALGGAQPAASLAAAIADLDDVLPIVAGAIVLAFVHPLGPRQALWLAAWAVMFAALVAFAAELLFSDAEPTERGTFFVGALALVAGGAVYVGGSALLAGFVVGLIWSRTPHAPALLDRHIRKLQHPLMVALLGIAGAIVPAAMVVVWLAIPLVLFRLTGKLVGGAFAARLAGLRTASMGVALAPPGIIGVAFALQVAQIDPEFGRILASAAAVATVANEALGIVLRPAEASA